MGYTNKGGATPHKSGFGKGNAPKMSKGAKPKTLVGSGSKPMKGTGKSHAMSGGGY